MTLDVFRLASNSTSVFWSSWRKRLVEWGQPRHVWRPI